MFFCSVMPSFFSLYRPLEPWSTLRLRVQTDADVPGFRVNSRPWAGTGSRGLSSSLPGVATDCPRRTGHRSLAGKEQVVPCPRFTWLIVQKLKKERLSNSSHCFLLIFNSNIWPNSAALRDINLWYLSDLDNDLSMSLNAKCDRVTGLPIYDFLLM